MKRRRSSVYARRPRHSAQDWLRAHHPQSPGGTTDPGDGGGVQAFLLAFSTLPNLPRRTPRRQPPTAYAPEPIIDPAYPPTFAAIYVLVE